MQSQTTPTPSVTSVVYTLPETAEGHLGNALAIVRAWKAERRPPTLEEYGAVVVRVQRAMRELERGNV